MSIIAKNITDVQNASGEIRAGGTDYMDRRRQRVTTGEIIDISRLPEMDAIASQGNSVSIGALVSIHTVAEDPGVIRDYPGLAMSAVSLATPQIRRAASMGGALLQKNRCWYFRHEDFSCFKSGGDNCPARGGNHKYGVCFDLGPCAFPHPSTLGMALKAYSAEVEVYGKGRRSMDALFGDGSDGTKDHQLAPGEILTAIHLPAPLPGEKAGYFRNIHRARAEWPLVEIIVRYNEEGGKIANASVGIGGVAPVPLLLPKVSDYLNGKTADEYTFKAAAQLGSEGANPLPQTKYKVEMIAGTLFETLCRAKEGKWGGEG